MFFRTENTKVVKPVLHREFPGLDRPVDGLASPFGWTEIVGEISLGTICGAEKGLDKRGGPHY